MHTSELPCPNCTEPMDETAQYCNHCGQKRVVGRLELSDILTHFTAEVLTWDSKYFRTIRDLTTKPAQVCTNYVAGKRLTYVNPLKYCLTVAALFFLLNAALGVDLTRNQMGLEIDTTPSASEQQVPAGEAVTPDRLEASRMFINSHINLVVFFSVPFEALALWFLFRGSGRNLAETFVFTLFLTGHVYLILLPLSILAAAFGVIVTRINPILNLCFFTWASIGFFGSSPFAAAWKNLLASIFRIIGVGIPVLAALLLYILYLP